MQTQQRFSIVSKFLPAMSETVTGPDPWAVGELTIRRIGNADYQRHLQQRMRSNPIARTMQEASLRTALLMTDPPPPPDESASAEDKAAYHAQIRETEKEIAGIALDSAMKNVELSGGNIDLAWDPEGAFHLLAGWKQTAQLDNGEVVDVPFSRESVLRLAKDSTLIPVGAGIYGEGLLVGVAFCNHLIERAKALEAALTKTLTDQLGNSEASSAGS